MRHLVALVLLALVTGCGGSTPAEPDQSGRSMPTTASRALAGSSSGTMSFATDWKAPFTGDHSRHSAVGCVRELTVLGEDLAADVDVTGPEGQDWHCAAVVESVSWAGAGPIGLAAHVSTQSAQRIRAAVLTGSPERRARLDLLVLDWDVDQRAWFAKMRTPVPLHGSVRGGADDVRVSIAETPTPISASNDTEVYSLYVEIAPTPDRQTVTVAIGTGRTFEKTFQD